MPVVPIRKDLGAPTGFAALSEPARKLTQQMLSGYANQCQAARNFAPEYATSVASAVNAYIAHSGQAPWEWNKHSYLAWMADLLAKERKSSTRRTYQQRVVSFLQYLVDDDTFVLAVKQRYSVEMRMFITRGMRIQHKVDSGSPTRRSISDDEFRKLHASMLEHAEELKDAGQKARYLLQLRDIAIARSLRTFGSRSVGLLSMEMDGFSANPDVPQVGKYGNVHMFDKGSKGSGPRLRILPVDDPKLPEVLHWYATEVRPHLVSLEKTNVRAFWLNQNGDPMKYGGLWKRMCEHLNRAGLGKLRISLHSFRRARITHRAETQGLTHASGMAFHANLGTTSNYVQQGGEFNRGKVKKAMERAAPIPSPARPDPTPEAM